MVTIPLILGSVACAQDPFQGPDHNTYVVGSGPVRKQLIAHRGASAYAPEHTLAAYRLAIEQGADYIEQDLQISRDGVLLCLHDVTLERTTNVEEVFPERYREVEENGATRKRWFVHDFTLEEIKQLDAGSWFDPKFEEARIPTWREAIEEIRGKAGLFPETKAPDFYGELGFEMEKLVLEELRSQQLDDPHLNVRTPVVIQSFSAESLRKMALELKMKLTLVLLIGEGSQEWLSDSALREVRRFASGIGPHKALLRAAPEVVSSAHEWGLTVTPYTFRSSGVGEGFADVRSEMHHFLYELGVDALFTDNPDLFPRR